MKYSNLYLLIFFILVGFSAISVTKYVLAATLITYEGTWVDNSGTYSVNGGQGYKATVDRNSYTNFAYEATVTISETANYSDAGMIFRTSNLSNGCDAYYGYYTGISASDKCIILGKSNGSWILLNKVSADIMPNIEYKIKVVAIGNNIKIYLNNILKINVNDNSFSSGITGFRSYCTNSTFSNNKVTAISTYGGVWNENSGAYSVDAGDGYKAVVDNTSYADFIYEASVRVENSTSNSNAGLIFRASSLANGCNAFNGYYVGINASSKCIILGKANGDWNLINEVSADIYPAIEYKIKIVAIGNNIKVYLNNILKVNINDNSFRAGIIGFRSYCTNSTFKDNKVAAISTYEGVWNENNGVFSVPAGEGYKAVITSNIYTDFIYEATVRVENSTSNSNAGLIFRASNMANGCNAFNGYYVGINAFMRCIVLGKSNSSWTDIEIEPANITTDSFHTIKIEAIGSNIKIYLDNELKIDVIDSTYKSGYLGFRTYCTDSSFAYANVTSLHSLDKQITYEYDWTGNRLLYILQNKVRILKYNYDLNGNLIGKEECQ